ncbi:uncharacterized protein PG998_007376 [Apiospora kogelbergensis]|uniref:uncharacterized protein n=1 Tax=Apiospora kogelbergensis TaxID=1337665 RepID=UPI00312E4EAF
MGLRGFFQKVVDKAVFWEDRINSSTFGRVFRLDGSGHPKQIPGSSFFREIRAGFTTFATMAYIIAVNSAVLSDTGGTCHCPKTATDPTCKYDAGYEVCVTLLKQDLVTSTAAFPGMGLNAYFTYQVVGWHGTGMVPYRIALTAVFVEGFIFLLLALTGMRQWLVKMIPATIKTACGVGIGLFLTEIGLSYSAGLGAITSGYTTPVAIGGCPTWKLDDHGECTGNVMSNPSMWIGIFVGGILVAFLMAFKVKSAIIIGIALVSIISWPRNTSFSYFPYNEAGNARFEFFEPIVAFHPIKGILNVQQWSLGEASGTQFVLALVTFLYVDIIDCTATLYSMARFCGVVEEDGDFPDRRSHTALMPGAGIADGGRTGLTAMTVGFCFLISLFFAPIFASVPPWATGPTLVLVGCLMIRQVTNINWAYIGDAVPSFVTLAFMPLSYSVAYGLIAGMLVYITLNTMIWVVVYLTDGRVVPSNWNEKEVYRFGFGKKDVPKWMLFIRDKMLGKGRRVEEHKVAVELVDNASAERNSSRNGSTDDKVVVVRPQYDGRPISEQELRIGH